MTCHARQHSDQMLCACGLAWDVNDPDPPECRRITVRRFVPGPRTSLLAEGFVPSPVDRGVTWVDVPVDCARSKVPDQTLRFAVDSFLLACQMAGLRVRQIKLGIDEIYLLRSQAPEFYAHGCYRGIPLRCTVRPRWQKETT